MLTFEEYDETIDDLEIKIEVLDRQINYRKIQLVGPKKPVETSTVTVPSGYTATAYSCTSVSVSGTYTEPSKKEDPTETDLVLQKLCFKKKRLEEELKFIKRTAELPE